MVNFAVKLSELMNGNKVTAYKIWKDTGIQQSMIGRWKSGRQQPSFEKIQVLANYFNVPADYLLNNEMEFTKFNLEQQCIKDSENRKDSISEYTNIVSMLIPVIGRIHTGIPIFDKENIIDYEYVNISNPNEYFYLYVDDSSMINSGIKNGSKVLIHRQNIVQNGQLVAFIANGDAIIKRYKEKGDNILLLSDNREYEPILISRKEFSMGSIQILGIAIRVISDL